MLEITLTDAAPRVRFGGIRSTREGEPGEADHACDCQCPRGSATAVEHPDRRFQGRLRRRRGRSSARRAAARRERRAQVDLREDAQGRRDAPLGEAERAARDGASLRRSAQLRRGARGHSQADRAVRLLRRRARAHADAAARRPRDRQDPFRAPHLGAARHRIRVPLDELAHRGLGALRILVAVEELETRQGIRDLPERAVRQPADLRGRDRQGRRRRAVRPARRALRPPRARHGAGVRRRVRRAADRRRQRVLGGHRERRGAHPRADPQPDERLRDRRAGPGRSDQDRAVDLCRDPQRPRLGQAVPGAPGRGGGRPARRP